MASKKYYVVWEGNETGIFDNWTDCQLAIKSYSGAKYKSFKSQEEAIEAYRGDYNDFINISKKKKNTFKTLSATQKAEIVWESISVDAACSRNPGIMEYRGVDTKSGIEIFRQGPFNAGTNNLGEFLALVHGLALLQKKGRPHLPIYSDSKIAMGWVNKKKPNTKLAKVPANRKLFELIDRAVKWLENNTYENPILKWDTKNWGEIPADFGRK